MAHVSSYGELGGQAPLVIAHGLFGSARNWNAIAKRLSDDRRVLVPDMRNHAHGPWHETHGYEDLAGDLAALWDGPVDLLGHSMGGKAAMMLALTDPGKVDRLIVADIAPVGYTHTQVDLIDAMQSVDLSGIARRSDAESRLAPLIEEQAVRAFLLQSLDVENKTWRFNLDVLRAEMDRIIGFPDSHATFDGTALFVSGGASDYVTPAHRDRIETLFPDARFERIDGAGHWLHAEKPREFEAVIRGFLND